MYYCKIEPVLWQIILANDNNKQMQTREQHNLLSPETYSPVFTSYASLCLSLALALELSLSFSPSLPLSISCHVYLSQQSFSFPPSIDPVAWSHLFYSPC